MAYWNAVQSQPHREALAAAHLRNQGFEVFLPASQRTVRHARKAQLKIVAFFPGYLFVREDLSQWRSINGTRGIRRIVMAGDQPSRVPVGLVESLMTRTDERGFLTFDQPIVPGDRVRIERGPFADLIGSVSAMTGDDRVKVLLDLMTMPVEVEIDRQEIMPAGDR